MLQTANKSSHLQNVWDQLINTSVISLIYVKREYNLLRQTKHRGKVSGEASNKILAPSAIHHNFVPRIIKKHHRNKNGRLIFYNFSRFRTVVYNISINRFVIVNCVMPFRSLIHRAEEYVAVQHDTCGQLSTASVISGYQSIGSKYLLSTARVF